MKRNIPNRHPAVDPIVWRGEFRGLKIAMMGVEQVVNWGTEVVVEAVGTQPPTWRARYGTSKVDTGIHALTAEDCMARAEAMFTTCVKPWEAFERGPFGKETRRKPVLVEAPKGRRRSA